MSFVYLKDDLITEAQALENIIRTRQEVEAREQAWFELWRRYRAAAISVLLAGADRETFMHRLQQSALARKNYLQEVAQERLPKSRFTCASLLEPYFDALIAGQSALAADIADLSPGEWNEDDEFEDDFCYAHFLFSYLGNGYQADDTCTALLKRFETALEGGKSYRLKVCQALCDADDDAFGEGLLAMHDEWQTFYKEKAKRLPWKDWVFLTEKALFMEGLGLLAVADRAGLNTEPEYPHMPSIARLQLATD